MSVSTGNFIKNMLLLAKARSNGLLVALREKVEQNAFLAGGGSLNKDFVRVHGNTNSAKKNNTLHFNSLHNKGGECSGTTNFFGRVIHFC
jgi:hypothetical protein